MCDTFDIAAKTVEDFIEKGEPFSILELKTAIDQAGGVFRVAPGCTIKDYLDEFIDKGIIFKGNASNKYFSTKVYI